MKSTAGSTYQTELADFSNITANGTAGNGPSYFTVQGNDGLTYQYGYTDANSNGANSQVLATGSATASSWLLSKVSDRSGNNWVINYTTLTGTAVPHTILWTPTTSGAASYAYSMTFNYGTNPSQSSLNKYVGGTSVVNNDLLTSVTIAYQSTVIRDYILAYQASTTTGRDELKTIQECTDSSQSNCLSASTIGYQSGAIGVSTSPTTALSSSGGLLTARYDLNGDGYKDLVYYSGTTWYVAFGSASGYGTAQSIGLPTGNTSQVLIGNLTGQTTADGILANDPTHGNYWYYYTWNSSTSTFTGVSTGLLYAGSTGNSYQLADVDGDGLPDLITLSVIYNAQTKKSTATVYSRLNTGGGGAVAFSNMQNTAYTLGGLAGAQLQTPDLQYDKLRRYDFNGDGRDDLVLQVETGTAPNFAINAYELLSTGTAFTPTGPIASGSGNSYPGVFFTNWNDDACTDFVAAGVLNISGCNGTVASASSALGNIVAAMDWDGDGRTDLIVATGATGSNLSVYLSNGALPTGSPTTTSAIYNSNCTYVALDANADGLDDLGCWSQSGSSPVSYYLHAGAGTPPDLATSFTDGFGNFVKPAYASITQQTNYFLWNDQTFPYKNFLAPYYEVTGATFSDPSSNAGATYYKDYFYAGAAVNLQGRGFMGFGAFETYDSRSGIYSTQNHSRSFPNVGMLIYKIDELNNTSAQAIKIVAPTLAVDTLDSTANNQRYFPYTSSVAINDYEVGTNIGTLITTTNINYGTPDSYGNFTNISKVVTDEDSGSPYHGDTWTSTVATTVSANTANWCLNLPTQTAVTNSSTAPNGASITRTVGYTPDYANCRETVKTTEPGSPSNKVTESYGFDAFGNINSDSVTGVGMTARTMSTTWSTTGQFPATVQNPLSQSISLTYDPNTGMKASQTDPNYTSSNRIQTTWAYDGFGRRVQENRPDGTYSGSTTIARAMVAVFSETTHWRSLNICIRATMRLKTKVPPTWIPWTVLSCKTAK